MIDISYSPKLSLRSQCDLLNINRSSYYYKPATASEIDLKIMRRIDEIYLDFPFYGSRKITVILNREFDIPINRKKTLRLMKLMGIEPIYQKAKKTTIANKEHRIYPYLLRNITIGKVNQVWAADITYIPMRCGFMYLIAIIDWCSRYIIGYKLSNSLEKFFCLEALEEAFDNGSKDNNKIKPEIFNTDQGSQFTSDKWTNIIINNDVRVSMDGKGRWIDNVIIERFFRSIKYEEIYINPCDSVIELKSRIKNYINYYNNERIHQSLDYNTPSDIYHGRVNLSK
jgi:putative transposase